MREYDPPVHVVRALVSAALAEDIGPLGDLTAVLVPAEATATVDVVARVDGVIAGTACATEVFAQLDPRVAVAWLVEDGEAVGRGAKLGEVSGPLRSVLTGERSALNFLCHLSGVASLTRKFVEAAGPTARIWDTRKTLPGLRAVEKAAVRAGGGMNHRGSLSEFVLVKDNHLAGTGITAAVRRARELWPGRTVEVECDGLEQVAEAAGAGADVVLLDNMDPAQVEEAVAVAHLGATGRILTEVSGGVTLATIGAYAAAGPDRISVGALTHSAAVLDLGLDLIWTAPGNEREGERALEDERASGH